MVSSFQRTRNPTERIPGKERREDYKIPSGYSETARQTQGRVNSSEETDRQEQRSRAKSVRAARNQEKSIRSDCLFEEKGERSIYPEVKQQHNHEPKDRSRIGREQQTERRTVSPANG